MEKIADCVDTVSISVYCCSILFGIKVFGVSTNCFQLWKQEVLHHGYTVLSSNCNAFIIIIIKEKWSNNPKSSYYAAY